MISLPEHACGIFGSALTRSVGWVLPLCRTHEQVFSKLRIDTLARFKHPFSSSRNLCVQVEGVQSGLVEVAVVVAQNRHL